MGKEVVKKTPLSLEELLKKKYEWEGQGWNRLAWCDASTFDYATDFENGYYAWDATTYHRKTCCVIVRGLATTTVGVIAALTPL